MEPGVASHQVEGRPLGWRLSVAPRYATVLICAVRGGLRDNGEQRVFRDRPRQRELSSDWGAPYDHV